MSDSEADTCRKRVVPRLQQSGWDAEPHSIAEQRTITDGRIVPVGKSFVRRPPKRADYLLGMKALKDVAVPVPPLERQQWFDTLSAKAATLRAFHEAHRTDLAALHPSLLDQAFKGEL